MRILALDLGTKCGYAIGAEGRVICSGMIDLASKRFEGGGMRFLRFEGHLTESLLPTCNLVVFEEVRRHLGTDAAHVYGGLMGILTATCEREGIPYTGVPVGTIKHHATGNGRADKDAMLASAQAKWIDREIKTSDEADALWLLSYAQTQHRERTVAK